MKRATAFMIPMVRMVWKSFPAAIVLFVSSSITAAPVTEVFLDLDHIHKADSSNGDTWDPFWADDGNLYAFNCDGRGFGTVGRNLAFNELLGDAPENLSGRMVKHDERIRWKRPERSGRRHMEGAWAGMH